MITADKTATSAAEQAQGEELALQTTRALVNQGDTVRASWRFSLDAVRSNIHYMAPEAKELLVWALTWCVDPAHPIHFADFCDQVGYSANTVYKLYSGKYTHPDTKDLMDAPEKLIKGIRDFRRLEIQRAKMGREQFVFTPTVKRVYWAIEQARKSRRPVMIYGGSQIGKTEAFRQNCIDFNHGKTILVEIEAVNGLKGLLQALAEKLGISPNANTPDLIARIKKALSPNMVVIIDEVHLLANVYRKGSFFACMEELRRIWDAVRFGLVLSYTDLGFEKTEKERKRELVQIVRRSVMNVNLGPAPTIADVRAVTNSFGLDWTESHEQIELAKGVADIPFAALRQLAQENGLTAILERIRLAHELAADDKREQITWRDFLTAHFAIKGQAQAPKTGWEN